MAKKHRESEKIKIQWDGDLSHPKAGQKNQSIPANVDLGKWSTWWEGTYVPDYTCPLKQTQAVYAQCYFEDYDINSDDALNVQDAVAWTSIQYNTTKNPYIGCIPNATFFGQDCNSLIPAYGDAPAGSGYLYKVALLWIDEPPKASETKLVDQSKIYSEWMGFKPGFSYTWGDVSFVTEIADGIGTGSRRARETRLNQFEEEKKKRLIRLICRVKGEKVYDEEKEMGDTYIKLEDAELVINEVLGKIRVENANVL